MTGNRISCLCFAALLAALPCTGFARLGENPQSIQQRYGTPLSTVDLPHIFVTRRQYQKLDYQVTVYYKSGRSVLEVFAKRGLTRDQAREVVVLVATHPVGSPSPEQESQLRQASGITAKDEVFWIWTAAASPGYATGVSIPICAAFDPDECTLAFFGEPQIYAQIQQALSSDRPTGS
jgi:hypothetical protein